MTGRLHDDEIRMDLALVRALVRHAFPALATLPLRPCAQSGSTNALFRLGAELVVRLPRQPGGSATITKEARWLPEIGPRLPVSVPEVVAVGEPALGYPERWSVLRWLPGESPPVVDPDMPTDPGRRCLAQDLAAVITALRRIGPSAAARRDPALRTYRGEPLATRNAEMRRGFEACQNIPGLDLNVDGVVRVWEEAMSLPGASRAHSARWYHGDLLAENLLVSHGRLTAVLDFGGLSVGDPTVDLIAAWEVLDAPARDVFRRSLEVDDATWLLARAWALSLAVMTFPYYSTTMPARCASRLAVIGSVLADAGRW